MISFFYDLYLDRKQIAGTPAPFLVFPVDRDERLVFSLITKEHLGCLFYHANDIAANFFYAVDRAWRGESTVKENAACRNSCRLCGFEKFQHHLRSYLHR